MPHQRLKAVFLTLCTLIVYSHAGPAAYGLCQAHCAAVITACYIKNGAIFGAVRAAGAPPALLRCNTAFGTCQATCASVWIVRATSSTAMDLLGQQMEDMSLGPTANEDEALGGLMEGFEKMNIK